ncbi:competence protein ComEC [Cryobacterium sp. MP_M5]|uniref:ComEC/Rec2 family competence protein n=1 Tax=unclassified Cryobacterium TaxID=2649013 RepID=UPI0018C94FEF|nr:MULTISPECIES: ComEC/Rec2 family competence protein [unclassified Cryobacterium]MBG6058317.1 competence protein ComEC [Cryobacterium sp. MP_M3]MEC5177724.1 competence protein ComEC [Cryobacterium sp. MP_M5]
MTVDLRLAGAAAAAWLVGWLLTGAPDWAAGSRLPLWTAAGAALALVVTAGGPRSRTAGTRVASARRVSARRVSARKVSVRTVLAQLTVCCAGGALVASAVAVAAPARLPAEVRDAAARHAVVTATLTVWSRPVETASFGGFGGAGGGGGSSRVRFTGTIGSVSQGGRTAWVSVPVVVFAEAPAGPALQIGTVIRLPARLRPAEPGDAAAALVFGRDPPAVVAAPPWWLAWANDLRARFADAAGRLPGEGGDLLPGLAIGDTSAVGPALDGAMKSSSLSHLTAVSGANCAVVTAGMLLLAGYLRLRRLARLALALVTLAGFVVLVTPEPSVLRAALMATVLLFSIATGRRGRGLPLLALVVIGLLVFDPWLARSYGFALSVLATGGLLVLAGPLGRVLGRWMPAWLAGVIAIPLAAQLACQPVLVLLSPTLPLYGVPANLLAGPAAPVATVIGLIGCLLLPWLPGVAWGILQLAWLPSAWIAAVAGTCAALPGSRLPWLGGAFGVAATAVLTLLALALLLGSARRPGSTRLPGWRIVAAAVLIVAGGGYAGSLIGAGLGRAVAFPADWQIAACDIGQGDAVVVRDRERYALVDVGPDPALLTSCLHTLGIERIDLLVLTHYDMDHIGGIEAAIGRVGTALVGIPENAQDEHLHARLAEGGADVRIAARGDRGTLGGLRWEIFWPVRGSPVMQTGNPGSVTIGFDGRGIRSIFLGDLGEEAQDALSRVSEPGRVDVVKVAHHGSRDQSLDLYADLRATVGLISVGADNGYGHPTDRLLDILASVGTVAVRTDRQGLAVVALDPGGHGALTVWTENAATGPARTGRSPAAPVGGPG